MAAFRELLDSGVFVGLNVAQILLIVALRMRDRAVHQLPARRG